MTTRTRRSVAAPSALALTSLLAILAAPAHAAVPSETAAQGLLTNLAGIVVDGAYDLVFELQDGPEGAVVWTEAHYGVDVAAGVFSVMLGGSSPLSAAILSGPSNLWTAIRVDGEPSMSAGPVGAVLFSRVASRALALDCPESSARKSSEAAGTARLLPKRSVVATEPDWWSGDASQSGQK